MRTRHHSVLRRAVALACVLAATMALTLPATAAELKFLSAGRHFEFTGDRDFAKVNVRITDSAPSTDLSVGFGFGNQTNYAFAVVSLVQEGGNNDSRLVKVFSFGDIKHVKGTNCEGEAGFVECRRGGFDWVKGRTYRIVIDRGNLTDDGRLWVLKIVDTETKQASQLLSFRTGFNRLAANQSGASLSTAVTKCADLNSVAAVIAKPVVHDGSVSWGEKANYKGGCTNATVAAPIDNGNMKAKITK